MEKASILIVDDDVGLGRSLSLILNKKGYETGTAGTGREALERVQERFFNVALLDIRLPDMEGIELLASLKRMHPDMIVLMVTAHASVNTAVQALNKGASAYITKPLNVDEVLTRVRETIEKQRLIMENRRLYQKAQRELSQRKRAQETFRHLAYHDSLTGLPNRTLFNNRLTLELAHAQRNRQKLAVVFLDLDRLKDINDTLGHCVGDKLLQSLGDRLTGSLRKSDTVARVGGDEFMLLLPEISKVEDVVKTAQKISGIIGKPFVLDGHEVHVMASIGIAIYPDDGEDVHTLMKNADTAMYHVKDRGGNICQRYTEQKKVRRTLSSSNSRELVGSKGSNMPSVQRRLRFSLVVIASQLLLIALAVAWLVHTAMIMMNGSILFVETNPIILWGEITATVLITLFATVVCVSQVKRLAERRRGDGKGEGG